MGDVFTMAEVRRKSEGKRIAAIAFLAAFVSTGAGFLVGNAWLLPALNALSIYPFYIEKILAGERKRAFALALLWAIFLSQAMIAGTFLFPRRAAKVTLEGSAYSTEMFEWVRTGQGEESSPKRFIPKHLLHFGVFVVLAVATGGLAALFMGAVLLNYMNFYVGSLVLAASHPVLTLFLGWQPYAIIRVISYIIVATALTQLSFALARRRRPPKGVWGWLAAGVAGVIVDIVVKSLIAAPWSGILRRTTGL